MKIPKPLALPFIITLILIVSSFIPIVQVLVLTLNGGILYAISQPLGVDSTEIIYSVNIVLSIVFILLFYLSDKLIGRLFSALATIIFLLPLLFYATENLISEEIYFLHFIIVGFIVGVVLIFTTLLKLKVNLPKAT